MRTRVLVLAPQAQIRAAAARILMPLGYKVEVASNEKTARQLIRKEQFAVAIVAAPTTAGDMAMVKELQSTVGKLVIFAEDAHAREQLAKSFSEALICASQRPEQEKLLAFLNDQSPQKDAATETASNPETLHFAGRTLDVTARIFLDANRREVALTRGEFALLTVFARNPGRVFSRTQLRKAIDGGSTDAYDRSIDMLVARLRRKIEPDAIKPQFIVTLAGSGYKFVPRVHCGDPAVSPALASLGPLSGARETPRAERRQVTVLSCQIVGFAALAAKLDPEDLEHAINPVYAACAEVVTRFGGTMARTLGDWLLAYFGYPKAQENDAESAVRAALELLRVTRTIKAPPIGNFRARIGIATGLMVVGESTVLGQQPAAIGEALNLVSHLQKAAPADGVVIAASTRDLIGRFFQCQQMAPVEIEEGHEPAAAWRVIDVASMPRFDALRREDMLDLVGREAEIDRLKQCWSKALQGRGQVVLVTGEAGIGKSRLIIELQEQLRDGPPATLRWFGLPHRSDAPMSMIIEELQRSAGLAADQTTHQKVEKLRHQFAALGIGAEEAMALSCSLLGLPYEAPTNVSQLSPQRRKERTFTALLARIGAFASRQALVAVVEDVQWVDPTSLEFITLLIERASEMRLLLVIIGRPEFTPSWPEHSHITTLALPRLSRLDAAALVQRVAGERHLPPHVEANLIIARADGVPLFIEELTKSVLENTAMSGDLAFVRVPRAAAPPPIPATLQSLLLMRLDRLEGGRDAAQAGAVIGREFSFELVRRIIGMNQRTLAGALDQLVASGLVFRHGSPPEATFVFKHALVRDAAYGMLLRERRQSLHADVARAYEEHLAETAQAQPELLAYHWREAGNPAKAVGYLVTAAERALHRSATTEALSHLRQAGELVSNLPANKDRLQLELQLEITLARALLAVRGYTAKETLAAYRRARECCEALGDQGSLPLIIHGQWLGAWIAADHQSALKRAGELYAWGERNCDQVGLAMAHCDFGITLTTLGRLVEARRHLDQALQINKFVLPGRQPFVASDVDGRISALSFMHNCLLLLGFPNQAETTAYEAISLKPENLYSKALAETRLLRMHVFARDARTVAERGPPMVRLAEEQGYPFLAGILTIYTGWALAQLGDAEAGTTSCERGLAQLNNIGAKCWLPLSLALLAECFERAGDRDRAAEAVVQALANVEATDERLWEAEIYRLKGKLLDHGGDAETAEVCFTTALRKAQTQQAKLLELRAAVSLGELFKRKRQPTRAREVLGPIYDSFTEGFDLVDLREAKTLLDSL